MLKIVTLVLEYTAFPLPHTAALKAEFEQRFGQKPPRSRKERTVELQRTVNQRLAELAHKLKQAFAEENAANAALRAYGLTMASLEADDPEGVEIRIRLENKRAAAKVWKKQFWTAHDLAYRFDLATWSSWQVYASYR